MQSGLYVSIPLFGDLYRHKARSTYFGCCVVQSSALSRSDGCGCQCSIFSRWRHRLSNTWASYLAGTRCANSCIRSHHGAWLLLSDSHSNILSPKMKMK